MAQKKQALKKRWDFIGDELPQSLNFTEVGTAGTPTGTITSGGFIELALTNDSEAQVAELNFNDKLSLPIADLQRVSIFASVPTTDIAANEQIFLGVGSARNDDPDNIATAAGFTCDGNMSIKVETDDGTTDQSVDSNYDLTKDKVTQFVINLKDGVIKTVGQSAKGQVALFRVGNENQDLRPVATPGKNMDLSGSTSNLQVICQLRKASGTTTPKLRIYAIEVEYLGYTC